MMGLAALAVLLAAMAAFAWPMLVTLHQTWSDKYGPHSHGYLVLALAVWFAVRAWRRPPRPVPSGPAWSFLPATLILLLLVAASEALYIGPSRTALLAPLILAVIGLTLGWQALMRLAWPVLFFAFALPVWGPLNEPLRQLTVTVSQALVHLVGIPVYVDGSFVHLPEGTFEIASGCSGLNYFVAALTLAAVFSTLNLRRWQSMVMLCLAAIAAALLANWLRVASLIVIGHVTHMQHYFIRVDHLWYGWVLFLVLMIPLYLYGSWLERREQRMPVPKPALPATPPAWLRALMNASWAVLGVMVLVGAWSYATLGRSAAANGPAAFAAFERGEDTGASFPSGWSPQYFGAQESRRRWNSPEEARAVEMYAGRYGAQTRDARLSFPLNSVTGPGWQLSEMHELAGELSPDGQVWLELRGALNGREHILWTRYDVAGAAAHSKISLRAREVLGALAGRRDGAVVAVQAECRGDCAGARRALAAFLRKE